MKEVKNILYFTLSNVGDVLMALPALDMLREKFPHAGITVIADPRQAEIFRDNPYIRRLVLFDKFAPLSQKVRFARTVLKEKFDLVIDLRRTLFGCLLGKRPHRVWDPRGKDVHSFRIHLYRAGCDMNGWKAGRSSSLFIGEKDRQYVDGILREAGIAGTRPILIAPGSRSGLKRWPKEKYREFSAALAAQSAEPVVLIGSEADRDLCAFVRQGSGRIIDLTGKTTLLQVACLLGRARMLVANDSGNMHLAGYLNVPTVALFGHSDDRRYGPWSAHKRVVAAALPCRPCRKYQCPRMPRGAKEQVAECMSVISPQQTLEAARELLLETAGESQK